MVIVKSRNHHSDVHDATHSSKGGKRHGQEGEEDVPTVTVGVGMSCGVSAAAVEGDAKTRTTTSSRGQTGQTVKWHGRQEQRRHASDSPTMRPRKRGGSARSQERVLPQPDHNTNTSTTCTTASTVPSSTNTGTASTAAPSKKKKDRKQLKSHQVDSTPSPATSNAAATATANPTTYPTANPTANPTVPESKTKPNMNSSTAPVNGKKQTPSARPFNNNNHHTSRRYYKKKWNHHHHHHQSSCAASTPQVSKQDASSPSESAASQTKESTAKPQNKPNNTQRSNGSLPKKKDLSSSLSSPCRSGTPTRTETQPTHKHMSMHKLDKKKKTHQLQQQVPPSSSYSVKSQSSSVASKKKHGGGDKSTSSSWTQKHTGVETREHSPEDGAVVAPTSKKATNGRTDVSVDAGVTDTANASASSAPADGTKKAPGKKKDIPSKKGFHSPSKEKNKHAPTTGGSSTASSSWKERKKHHRATQPRQKKLGGSAAAAHHNKQNAGSSSTAPKDGVKRENHREEKVISPMTVGSSASAPRGGGPRSSKQKHMHGKGGTVSRETTAAIVEGNAHDKRGRVSQDHDNASQHSHEVGSTASSCENRISSPVPITSVVTNEAGAAILRSISGCISHVESTSSSVSSLPLPPSAGGGFAPLDHPMYASSSSSLSMHHPLSPTSMGAYGAPPLHGQAHHLFHQHPHYPHQHMYGQPMPPPHAGFYPMHYPPTPMDGGMPLPHHMYGAASGASGMAGSVAQTPSGASAGGPSPHNGWMIMPSAPEGFYYLSPSSGVAIPFDGKTAAEASTSLYHEQSPAGVVAASPHMGQHSPPMEPHAFGENSPEPLCGEYGYTNAHAGIQAPLHLAESRGGELRVQKHLNAEAKEFQPRNR